MSSYWNSTAKVTAQPREINYQPDGIRIGSVSTNLVVIDTWRWEGGKKKELHLALSTRQVRQLPDAVRGVVLKLREKASLVEGTLHP